MDELTLFVTEGCSKCTILKKKLDLKGLKYKVETDVTEPVTLGYLSAPILKTAAGYLEFPEAIKYISEIN